MVTPLHILVVEDRVNDVELLVLALRESGFEPRWERVETEADYLSKLDPSLDLIFCDYQMPRFGGLRALQLLKERGLDIPLIIVSGTASEEMAAGAMQAGARDYFMKDNLARLAPAVERELREAKLRQERRGLIRVLATQEEMLAGFFSSSPAGMAILDSEFRFVQINQTLAQINGLSAQEHLGKTLREMLPHLASTVEPVVRGVFESGKPVLNVEVSGEVPSQPGVVRHWVESYFPIPGPTGAPIAVGSVVLETTERKRAEEALRESEEGQRTLFESAPDPIVVADAAGRINRVNRQAEMMFGYERRELIDQPVEMLIPERFRDNHERHRAGYIGAPHLRLMGARLQLYGRRKDGSEFPVDVMLSPLTAKNGTMVIAVVRDITQRKREEMEREGLFKRVAETKDRLQLTSLWLMHAQEAERRRIARELHDEVGQTLTALKLGLQMCEKQPDPVWRDYLREATQRVDEMLARVRNISLDLRPAMLDDMGLLPSLLWHFERFTTMTSVRVDFQHFGLEHRRFPAEIETAAYRIMQEALTNVARHAGVKEATVRVWADEKTLGVQIEDQGKGFDAPVAVAAANSSGLYGMRERVTLLGGDFEIESAADRGTRLSILLPVKEEARDETDHHRVG